MPFHSYCTNEGYNPLAMRALTPVRRDHSSGSTFMKLAELRSYCLMLLFYYERIIFRNKYTRQHSWQVIFNSRYFESRLFKASVIPVFPSCLCAIPA